MFCYMTNDYLQEADAEMTAEVEADALQLVLAAAEGGTSSKRRKTTKTCADCGRTDEAFGPAVND